MGDYERDRAAHIARNQVVLAELGFEPDSAQHATTPHHAHPLPLHLCTTTDTAQAKPCVRGAALTRAVTLNKNDTIQNDTLKAKEHDGKDAKQVMQHDAKQVMQAWAHASVRLLTWLAAVSGCCSHRLQATGVAGVGTAGTAGTVDTCGTVAVVLPAAGGDQTGQEIANILRRLCHQLGLPLLHHNRNKGMKQKVTRPFLLQPASACAVCTSKASFKVVLDYLACLDVSDLDVSDVPTATKCITRSMVSRSKVSDSRARSRESYKHPQTRILDSGIGMRKRVSSITIALSPNKSLAPVPEALDGIAMPALDAIAMASAALSTVLLRAQD